MVARTILARYRSRTVGDLYDLDSFRPTEGRPPGAFCDFRPGDVVALGGLSGEIVSYEGVAEGADRFGVQWEDGTGTTVSHPLIERATAVQRRAYVDRRIDEQPEPSFSP